MNGEGRPVIDRRACDACGECAAACGREDLKVVGREIQEIPLPPGCSIVALVRDVDADHPQVLMAHHNTVILGDDHVILFVADKRMIPKVEKLFQVSAGFF